MSSSVEVGALIRVEAELKILEGKKGVGLIFEIQNQQKKSVSFNLQKASSDGFGVCKLKLLFY